MFRKIIYLLLLALSSSLFAQSSTDVDPTVISADSIRNGAVFSMTNAADGNEVVVYHRDNSDGTLKLMGYEATGGLGRVVRVPPNYTPIDALGTQYPMVLSRNNRFLFVVNAGSDEISSFRVDHNGLTLIDVIPSGGDFPASLALDGGKLYVLNAGGEANITGFNVEFNGILRPIPNSTRALNVGGESPPFFLVSPAQISFDPRGEMLIVSIKGSNEMRIFLIGDDDRPSDYPVLNTSEGNTPFGFTFDRRGHLVMTEAFGINPVGTGNSGAVSTYEINNDGTLNTISTSVENFQTATCWIVTNNRATGRRLAYASNNLSGTITGYRYNDNGSINLLKPNGISANQGPDSGPLDLGYSRDGRFLYVANAGSGTVSAYEIDRPTGDIRLIQEIDGLPVNDGAVGLAAF